MANKPDLGAPPPLNENSGYDLGIAAGSVGTVYVGITSAANQFSDRWRQLLMSLGGRSAVMASTGWSFDAASGGTTCFRQLQAFAALDFARRRLLLTYMYLRAVTREICAAVAAGA